MSDDNLAEDLDDSMSEILNDIKSSDDYEDDSYDDATEHEPEAEGSVSERSETESDGRNRDEKGRFKTKSQEGGGEEIGEDGEQESLATESLEQPDTEQPEIAQEDLDPRLQRPPTTWRTEAKLKWEKIDPGIREEILKREEDIGRGITHYKQMADYGNAVQQTVQPYMPMINAAGSTPQKTIGSMLDTYYQLRTADPQQKSQLLLQVAQQHGADMSVFQNGIDPGQVEMQNHLQPLQAEIQQLKYHLTQRDQQAQQFEVSQAQNDIHAFSSALNDDGKPRYPHFDIVRNQMADLIESNERAGNKITLEQAYENAIWQTPEIRQHLLSEQTVSSETVRQQSLKAKTSKAKRADKVNLQTKGSYDDKPNKPTGNLNSTLKETLRDINQRETS